MYDARLLGPWLGLLLPLSGCMLFGYDLGSDERGRAGDGGAGVLPPEPADGGGADSGSSGRGDGGNADGGSADGGSTTADAGTHAPGSDGGTLLDAAADAAVPDDAGGADDRCLGMLDGTSCEDGSYCVFGEVCSSGVCIGTAKNCGFVADACNTGVCSEQDDACIRQPVANGTPCGSGQACAEGVCTDPLSCGGAGQTCSLGCSGTACSFDCVDAESCTVACDAGASCILGCAGADACTATCSDAECFVDCTAVNDCDPTCSGGHCQIDCTDANNCDQVICAQGATCAIQCAGANNCEFAVCEGGVSQCDEGVIVCNGDCGAWTWRSTHGN